MWVNGKHSATRDHILQSALKIFAECGYAATSIQHIVDKARVSKPALYYYFGDKAGLFRALVERAHDERLRLMQEAAAKGGTLGQKLENILTAVFEFTLKNRELMRLAFATALAAKGETPVQPSCCEKGRRNFEFVRDLIEAGQSSGELNRNYDVNEMAMAIYGQLNSYVMLRLFTPDVLLNRKTAKAIVGLFLDGAAGGKLQTPQKLQAPGVQYWCAEWGVRLSRDETLGPRLTSAATKDMKRIVIGILIVLVVIAAIAGIKTMQIKTLIAAGKAFHPPPETVSTAVVREEKWQGSLSAIGSISAVQGVTVTPEIAGTITEIAFESGAIVAKGDLLVKLDTSSEEAQLRSLQAQVQWAKVSLDRQSNLRTNQLVSQSDWDAADAAYKQAFANADNVRSIIEKKTLRAPFAGKLGIRQVNLGQYLEAGKPIVSLQALDPVYADFSLPQQDLAQLKPGMKVRVTSDTYTNRQFEGTLLAINPDLDSATRSVGIRATLNNADQALRPGMYAKVDVLLPEEKSVVVIPATSILSAPYGDSVYVIVTAPAKEGEKAALTVRQQFVRVGQARGDLVTIDSGLKPGDKVVSGGVFKLRNGVSIVENNELVPKSEKSPHPPEA